MRAPAAKPYSRQLRLRGRLWNLKENSHTQTPMPAFPRIAKLLSLTLLGWGLFLSSAVTSEVEHLLADLRQSIPLDELAEPGSTVWPEMVDEAASQADDLGLSAADQLALGLAAAEAWIAAGQGQRGIAWTKRVLEAPSLDDDLRQRAGLALVAAWQALVEGPDGDPAAVPTDPLAALADFGEFAAEVRARAHVVAALAGFGEIGDDHGPSLDHLDRALELLAGAPAAQRVPVFTLRLHAMELAEADMDAIRAWLERYHDDPAINSIRDALFTASQGLVGQEAPQLSAPRLDGVAGEEAGEVALEDFRGSPVLVYFSATWSQGSRDLTPQLLRLAAAQAPPLQILEVSLDTRDTIPAIAAYVARFGISHPIIGEGLGWDGELSARWHIDAIPSVILVDGRGRVATTNLVGDELEATKANIVKAIQRLRAPASEEGTQQ